MRFLLGSKCKKKPLYAGSWSLARTVGNQGMAWTLLRYTNCLACGFAAFVLATCRTSAFSLSIGRSFTQICLAFDQSHEMMPYWANVLGAMYPESLQGIEIVDLLMR